MTNPTKRPTTKKATKRATTKKSIKKPAAKPTKKPTPSPKATSRKAPTQKAPATKSGSSAVAAQQSCFALLQKLYSSWKAPKKELDAPALYQALLTFAAQYGAKIGGEEAQGGHVSALARDKGDADSAAEEIADLDWFGETQEKITKALKTLPEDTLKQTAPRAPKAKPPLTRIVDEMGSAFRHAAEKAMLESGWRDIFEEE